MRVQNRPSLAAQSVTAASCLPFRSQFGFAFKGIALASIQSRRGRRMRQVDSGYAMITGV